MVFMQQDLHVKQQIYCLINWPQILNKNNFEMQGYLNFGDNLMIHADKKGTRNWLMIKDKNVFWHICFCFLNPTIYLHKSLVPMKVELVQR